jgi:cation transport ATPase
MTCAACAARVERRLNRLDGVSAAVNFATGQARVTTPAGMPAGVLIAAVEDAGYAAALAGSGPRDGEATADAAHARYLRRRLYLALAFYIPLTDVSVQFSLFPSFRFPGWQWLLIALAAPVAVWAAWPFHRAAFRNAWHGTVSMDTLVSLGVIAACGWSVYAMFVLDRGQAAVSGWYELVHASGGGIYLEVAASVTTFLLAGRFTRPGPGARPGTRCGNWPPRAPGRCRSSSRTGPSTASRWPGLRPGTGSSCARASGSPPTGRCCRGGPRWTPA